MILSTLCYIERDGCYLMLHRVKKDQDVNAGKWIGVGGKIEKGESPDDCILREVKEETGLTLLSPRMRGVITFVSQGWEDEIIFLYTAEADGEMNADCGEGVLKWVPIADIPSLNLWQGDRVFLRFLLEGRDFFSLKLSYIGDDLCSCVLNGTDITASGVSE